MIIRELTKPTDLTMPDDKLVLPALAMNFSVRPKAGIDQLGQTFLQQSCDQLFEDHAAVYAVCERPDDDLLAIAKLLMKPGTTDAWLSRLTFLEDLRYVERNPKTMDFTIQHLATVARDRGYKTISLFSDYQEVSQYEARGFVQGPYVPPLREMTRQLS